MLSRAIHELFHLRRVHAVMSDRSLGLALAGKLQRLDLAPAVAALSRARVTADGANAQLGAHRPQLTFDSAETAALAHEVLPDLSSLTQLLECLAYFELAKTEVAANALRLTQAFLPVMTRPQLARTLAAVCALGQQNPRVPMLQILTAALEGYSRSVSASDAVAGEEPRAPRLRTVSPATAHAESTVDEQGVELIRLMEALQSAEVRQEEVWSLLAEHCVRHMDVFDGKELFRVVELLYIEGVTYYPDFFVAVESYLSAQPLTFLSSEHRQRLVEYYKELGQPVVSLLAASTSGVTDSFDAALAALPASSGGESSALSPGAAAATPSASNSAALDAFTETAVKAIRQASEQDLMELLRRCELKGAMCAPVMSAAVARVAALYFPQGVPAAAASGARPPSHSSLDLARLVETLRTILDFDDRESFRGSFPAGASGGASTAATLSAVLDAVAAYNLSDLRSRLLPIARGAVTALPPPPQPAAAGAAPSPRTYPHEFYEQFVAYARRSRETLAGEGAQRLLTLATVLQALPGYGGRAVLEQYVPYIALASSNAPMRVQVQLATLLSTVPSARAEVLPALYAAIGAPKGWSSHLQPAEAKQLVLAMVRSRVMDATLVAGVRELLQLRRASFEPSDLVWFMHSLAVLGVRDLEFFSSTTEYLLDAVSPTSRTRTSVHDLCDVLYVLTFVLKGVIRVVQQVMARLRVGAGQATPRDITLALYSLVKLQVARHQEVTSPLCDRAVAVLPTFRFEELASMLGSLRALQYTHAGLMKGVAARLLEEASARRAASGRATDAQYVTTVGATVALMSGQARRRLEGSRRRPLAGDGAAGPPGGGPRDPRPTPSPSLAAAMSARTGEADTDGSLVALFTSAAAHGGTSAADPLATVCAELRRAAVRSFRQAALAVPSSARQPLSGTQVHGAVVALAAVRAHVAPPLSSAEWSLLASEADAHAEQLAHGGGGQASGCAAAEVLVALKQLHASVVPALPSEEVSFQAAVAVVDQWALAPTSSKGGGADSPGGARMPLPPRVLRHIRQHLGNVAADGELREELRRGGLLSAVTAADSATSAADFSLLLGDGALAGAGDGASAQRLAPHRVTPAMHGKEERTTRRQRPAAGLQVPADKTAAASPSPPSGAADAPARPARTRAPPARRAPARKTARKSGRKTGRREELADSIVL